MKINCLPNQAKIIKSSYHTDLLSNSNYKTLILSINDAESKDGGKGAIIIKLKNL